MAINAAEITTDITLELDQGDITIADFDKAAESFFGLVKEVSREMDIKGAGNAWTVKVYSGSIGVGVSGLNLCENEINAVRFAIVEGLDELLVGSRPKFFSDRALEHARGIASLFKNSVQPNIRLWSKAERSFPVVRDIAKHVSELLDEAHEEHGSIEGKLERVDSHGKLQFVVYDSLDNHAIKCDIDEDQVQDALTHWRKRVEVVGSVRYRKDGTAVGVKARRIIPFPVDHEIPSLQEMRQLLRHH